MSHKSADYSTFADLMEYGDCHILSIFATKAIVGDLSVILETRNEFRRKDRASGSYYITLSPQLNHVAGELHFSAMADLPVYSYLNGKQLATAAAVAPNLLGKGKSSTNPLVSLPSVR